jgi:hypothetical protein
MRKNSTRRPNQGSLCRQVGTRSSGWIAKTQRGVLEMAGVFRGRAQVQRVGQTVSFISGPFGRGGTNGVYTVTQLLPPAGDDNQYRIKNVTEPHERVVKESQLNRIL